MSSDTTDRFIKAAGGRFPTASGISSARFWTPHKTNGIQTQDVNGTSTAAVGENVPRPDRSLNILRWLSIFPLTGLLGIDHFYLRSPTTGVVKLLTFGGVGLWYLWDALQLGLEGGRVLDFGMSLPFDLKTGLGQGMITDQPSQYTQKTSFAAWTFATVFGFLGVDLMMLGQFWKGIAKLLYFIFFIAALVPFVLDIQSQGLFTAVKNITWLRLLLGLIMGFAAMGVGIIWVSNLTSLLVDPKYMMDKGLGVPEQAKEALGWWEQLYQNDIYCKSMPDPNDPSRKIYTFKPDDASQNAKAEYDNLIKQFRFTVEGITGKEFRERFWISHGQDDTLPETVGASEGATGIPLIKLFFRALQNGWTMIDKYILTPISVFIKTLFSNSTPLGQFSTLAGMATGGKAGGADALLGAAGSLFGKSAGTLAGRASDAVGLGAARAAQLGEMFKNPTGVAAGLAAGAVPPNLAAGLAAGAAPPSLAAGLSSLAAGAVPPNLATGLSSLAAGAVPPNLATGLSSLAAGAVPPSLATGAQRHVGGARSEPMSTEAKIAAATVAALASAGALKGLIDFLVA